jgi:hypothetical protein
MTEAAGKGQSTGSGYAPPIAPDALQDIGLPTDSGTEPLPVIRSIWFCFLMLLGSFGVWSFAWIWHTAMEVSPRVQLNPGESSMSPKLRTGLLWVPIVGYVIVYQSWRDINRFAQDSGRSGFSPGGFLAGYIAIGLFCAPLNMIFPCLVQSPLNDAWRLREPSRATKAPLMTADWITLSIGLGLWVIVILAVVLSSGS